MERILPDLLIVLALVVATTIWILALRYAERSAAARFGEHAEVVDLHVRGLRLVQHILTWCAVLAPALMLLPALTGRMAWDDALVNLVRSVWLGSLAYGFRRSSRLLVGPRGFALGSGSIVPWERVEEVRWDRDIGQHSWGVSIRVRKARTVQKRRYYVPRDMKPRVESLLDRFGGTRRSSLGEGEIIAAGTATRKRRTPTIS